MELYQRCNIFINKSLFNSFIKDIVCGEVYNRFVAGFLTILLTPELKIRRDKQILQTSRLPQSGKSGFRNDRIDLSHLRRQYPILDFVVTGLDLERIADSNEL